MKLILASTSPFRKKQLEQMGLDFQTDSPPFDEETFKNKSLTPRDLAETLACEKAKSLRKKYPDQTPILGGDQLVHLKGKILGKPQEHARATQQLLKLQGQTHELITSICIYYKGQSHIHTNITKMTMRKLSQKSIESYLLRDQPYNCAGSYKIENCGIQLFEKIETDDFTSIIGIPLIGLTHLIKDLGLKPLGLVCD